MKSSCSLALLCAAALLAQAPAAVQKILVHSIEVAEVSTDRVRLRLQLDGSVDRDIHVRTLTFDDAFINGVPVFAAPLNGPRHIPKGARLSALEPIEATVFYRDLPTLEPLRQLVREEKADVRATVRLQPEFSLFQRIALWTSTASVSWKVERTVRVHLPGGRAGKTAAELTLAAADAVWVVGRRGLEWRSQRDAIVQQIKQLYSSRVLVAETRYRLRKEIGELSTVMRRGLVFHAGDGELLAPAEMVEPWMFDSVIPGMLAAGKMELVQGSVDIRLANGSKLEVVKVAEDGSKGLSVERRRTFDLRNRDSVRNAAVLRSEAMRGPKVVEASAAAPAYVFRLREDGSTELLSITLAEDNGRFRILEPVDYRVFGSPVMTPAGVVGIVVSQASVLPLRAFR